LIGLRERHAGLQARESSQVVVAAALALLGGKRHRPPHINRAPQERMLETRRHDADDCERRPAYLELGADDIGVPAQTLP
jgi:hypothetical protein